MNNRTNESLQILERMTAEYDFYEGLAPPIGASNSNTSVLRLLMKSRFDFAEKGAFIKSLSKDTVPPAPGE